MPSGSSNRGAQRLAAKTVGSAGLRLAYLPQLDGLRAVAVLLVLGGHAFRWPQGGFVGVDIFFVLSGFLITALLVQEWGRNGTIALGHFYFRRVLRLYPALCVLLLAYLAYVLVVYAVGSAHDWSTVSRSLWGTLYGALYVTNLMQAAGDNVPAALTHLWSLSTEEQFYLLWPPLLLLALRAGATRRQLTALLVLAISLVFAHRLRLTLDGVPTTRLYFGPDAHLDVVLVGCVAGLSFACGAVPSVLRERGPRRLLTALSVAVLSGAALSLGLQDRSLYLGLLTVIALAAAVVVVSAAMDAGSLLSRALQVRPLVYLGKISYGVYLWQQVIVFGVGRFPPWAEIALSIAAASLSYHVVEQWFLRLKRRDREEIDARGGGAASAPASEPSTLVLPPPAGRRPKAA